MPPTNRLRELSATRRTIEPEPRAKMEISLGSRTLILCAFPWSARLIRAERPPLNDTAPIPDDDLPDIVGEIAQLSRYAAAADTPLVSDGYRLDTVSLLGGQPDASEWGFLNPDAARRRAAIAHRQGYGDLLHDLAEDVAHFTAAVVRHHLTPSPQSRREVERCGVSASVLIVAIVRRVTT